MVKSGFGSPIFKPMPFTSPCFTTVLKVTVFPSGTTAKGVGKAIAEVIPPAGLRPGSPEKKRNLKDLSSAVTTSRTELYPFRNEPFKTAPKRETKDRASVVDSGNSFWPAAAGWSEVKTPRMV